MRSFIIAVMLVFALVACEDTTSTTETTTDNTTKTTTDNTKGTTGTTSTGDNIGNTTNTSPTLEEIVITPENTGVVNPTEVDVNNETNTVPSEGIIPEEDEEGTATVD